MVSNWAGATRKIDFIIITESSAAGLPQKRQLPVLFLLTGQKSAFSPSRGDSLHRIT